MNGFIQQIIGLYLKKASELVNENIDKYNEHFIQIQTYFERKTGE